MLFLYYSSNIKQVSKHLCFFCFFLEKYVSNVNYKHFKNKIEQILSFLFTSDSDSSGNVQDACNATDLHVASLKVSVWISGCTPCCTAMTTSTGWSHHLAFVCCGKSVLNYSIWTCFFLDILCSGHTGRSNVLQTWEEHNSPKQKWRAGRRPQADHEVHF